MSSGSSPFTNSGDCEVLAKWHNVFAMKSKAEKAFVDATLEFNPSLPEIKLVDLGALGKMPYKDLIYNKVKFDTDTFDEDKNTFELDNNGTVTLEDIDPNGGMKTFFPETEGFSDNVVFKVLAGRIKHDFLYSVLGNNTYLVVNPAKFTPKGFGDHSLNDNAQGAMLKGKYEEVEPTMENLAARMLHTLFTEGKDCVLSASGISGSGKTYNTTKVLNYLLKNGPSGDTTLIETVSLCKNVLEVFGNASTVNNPNSSRYIQTIELTYSFVENTIDTENYIQELGLPSNLKFNNRLLQSITAWNISTSERFFHIYHVILSIVDKPDSEAIGLLKLFMFDEYTEDEGVKNYIKYYLKPIKEYVEENLCKEYYTVDGATKARYTKEDTERLEHLQDLYLSKLSNHQNLNLKFKQIMRTVMVCLGLLLLNNKYLEDGNTYDFDDKDTPDPVNKPVHFLVLLIFRLINFKKDDKTCLEKNWADYDKDISDRSQISETFYKSVTQFSTVGARVGDKNNQLQVIQAIYNTIFANVAEVLNKLLKDVQPSSTSSDTSVTDRKIKILDIFGFEQRFQKESTTNELKPDNGLAQLLINFANEYIEYNRYSFLKRELESNGYDLNVRTTRFDQEGLKRLKKSLTSKTVYDPTLTSGITIADVSLQISSQTSQTDEDLDKLNEYYAANDVIRHYAGPIAYKMATVAKQNEKKDARNFFRSVQTVSTAQGVVEPDGVLIKPKNLNTGAVRSKLGNRAKLNVESVDFVTELDSVIEDYFGRFKEPGDAGYDIKKDLRDKVVLFNLRNFKPKTDITQKAVDENAKVEELLLLQQCLAQNIFELYFLLKSRTENRIAYTAMPQFLEEIGLGQTTETTLNGLLVEVNKVLTASSNYNFTLQISKDPNVVGLIKT